MSDIEYRFAERNTFRAMNPNDFGRLLTALGAKNEEVPIQVMDNYWQCRELCDRLGIHVMSDALILTVIMTSAVIHAAPAKRNLLQLWQDREVVALDWVEVLYRDEWIKAQIMEVNKPNSAIRVLIQGKANSTEFPLERVRLVPKNVVDLERPQDEQSESDLRGAEKENRKVSRVGKGS